MGTPQSSIICKITLPQGIQKHNGALTLCGLSSFGKTCFMSNLKRWGFFCASVSKLSRVAIFTSRILCPDQSPKKVCLPASHHMCTLTSLQGPPRACHEGEVHRAAAARSIMHCRVVAPELVHYMTQALHFPVTGNISDQQSCPHTRTSRHAYI
jgi:hypothetical protein